MKIGLNQFCIMSLAPKSMQQRIVRHNTIQMLIGWLALLGSAVATIATFWLFYAIWSVGASVLFTAPWSGSGWLCGLVGTILIFWAGWREAHREPLAYYEIHESGLERAFGSVFWCDLEMTFLMIAIVIIYKILLLAPLLYVTARRRFHKCVELQPGKAEHLCALWKNVVGKRQPQSMVDYASCVEEIHELIDIGMLEYSRGTRRFQSVKTRMEELGINSDPSLPSFTTTDPGNPRSGSGGRP